MKLTRKISLIGSVLIVSLIISSAVFGVSSLEEKMALIKNGDGKAEVLRLFGEPQSKQFISGREVWTYIDNGTTQAGRFGSHMTNMGLGLFGAYVPGGMIPSMVAGGAIDSRNPNQTNHAVINFDNDGLVIIPNSKGSLYQEPDYSTSGKGSVTSVQEKPMVHKEESLVVVKEPKHVYVDNSQICHKPDCIKIKGIEKRTLQRVGSIEQALQAENRKCDSCMKSDETGGAIYARKNVAQSMPTSSNSNGRKATETSVYTAKTSNIYHKRDCSELITTDLLGFSSPQEARESGGVPCKNCNP